MILMIFVFLATCFLSYSNGANDNFKGVASLFGSRTTSYRTALTWATITTFAGSIAAIFLAQALLKRFSGKGLVPDALVASPYFLLAVAIGAALTVILATLTGFPVSTTHALIGGLVGCGLLAVGTQVNFAALQKSFLTPLLLSPVLAIVIAGAIYLLFHFVRVALRIPKEWCVCIGAEERIVPMPQVASPYARATMASELKVIIGEASSCAERYSGSFLGIRSQSLMDGAHFLSAGAVCFARALNDTPKVVAMLLVMKAMDIRWGFFAVVVTMVLGGLIHSRKIAETMSHKITGMNHSQGFSANFCTGLLVILASVYGLPVSTTHVAVGSLFGVGLTTGQTNPRVMMNIVLSWVVTLPCAALLSAIIYWLVMKF